MATRAIYNAFYNRCADMLTATGGKYLYSDAASLGSCAAFLLSCMGCLQNWRDAVPRAMKTKRKAGSPLSTYISAFDIERLVPEWRRYVSFAKGSAVPNANECATLSVRHAMAVTRWNAALTMIGLVLAYPISSIVADVRAAIESAVAAFDTMGKSFVIAASAANVTRDVTAKADFLRQNTNILSPDMDLQSFPYVDS
ncbi:uncharacterized protein ATNIH1004_010109 [Aspergillus tanneri]|uniref:Uncharacterized protein n=1 Tax=Aspergillus tanneri TaxID=1220188 RepID=A0A5M9M8G1_9EURO|nr:uncharacterized protein ATNIH1004_010109 [Aspergillus tanneri]KAA8643342.1 hypothetical protein ATNIH1004_010109 [Aspergillus tanneri]